MTVENTNGDATATEVTTRELSADDQATASLEELVLADDIANVPDEDEESTESTTEESDDDAGEDDEDSDDDAETEDDEEPEEEESHRETRSEKRISKLVAQRNELRDKLETTESRLKAIEGRVGDNLPLELDYLSDADAKLIRQANDVMQRKKFLLEHVGVGFEDPKDESKSLSPKQVAMELAELEGQTTLVADAQKLFSERLALQKEDLKAGRLLRLSREKLKKSPAKVGPKVAAQAGSAGSARKPAVSQSPRRGVSVERFQKSGATDDAALRELEELVPG
jgi:hypothetical protein